MKQPLKNQRSAERTSGIVQLGLGILIIAAVNVIGSFLYTRTDLTAERRHSLSPATKELLRETDDIVYFRIYLEGDFPAGFMRLRNATKEMLDEFRAYNKNIQYEFVDPSRSDDPRERNDTYQLLIEKGLQPTDLQVNTKQGRQQQVIFPGAIASYRAVEQPVELLQSQIGAPPEEALNNSVQGLEFRLASTIRNLTVVRKPRVAFIRGHGELGDDWVYDAAQALGMQYDVDVVKIEGRINSLTGRDSLSEGSLRIANKYNAIIIAKPDSAFSEKDKFIIDQYVMRGGSVLWLIDPVFATMDSLQSSGTTIGIARELNLEDMLFEYGVRLNADLVMDLNALPIPLRTGQIGNQPQIDFFPWYYFPVLTPVSSHPVVNNLNAIKTEFISSMDTIRVRGVKKTILLKTSHYSRVVSVPALISLAILQDEPDQRLYQGPPASVAVLLEGTFRSVFTNRIPPEIALSPEIGFFASSRPSRMIVVADGDVIKNQLHYAQGYPLPLGYDQYTGETFGNKDFILNAVDYLTDESGLIAIRSRELRLRLLDTTRVTSQRLFWQGLNLLLPVALVLLFGGVSHLIRKRKYAK
jgi:ABC-2 type transport system permease protein